MKFPKSKYLKEFDNSVSEITGGLSFINWAENTAQELVEEASSGASKVNILKILEQRNIVLKEESDPHSIYKARIERKQDHYNLFLSPETIFNNSEKKFILAHEIAHTLFYFHKDSGYEKLTHFSPGSKEIEYICDYIAFCILLPKKFVEEEIKVFKKKRGSLIERNENYLKFIFYLSAKYEISWINAIYRLICNFEFLPNSLIVDFIKKDKWYLNLTFQTDSISEKKLFIPVKAKEPGQRVSAKKSFLNILNVIEESIIKNKNKYGYVLIEKNNFESNYMGNFKQFLNKFFDEDLQKLKIYYRVNNKSNIVLLFPFDGLLK